MRARLGHARRRRRPRAKRVLLVKKGGRGRNGRYEIAVFVLEHRSRTGFGIELRQIPREFGGWAWSGSSVVDVGGGGSGGSVDVVMIGIGGS